MPNISDYYNYSILANAAYINLDGQEPNTANLIREAKDQGRIPTIMAEQLFKSDPSQPTPVWVIPTKDVNNNPTTGAYQNNRGQTTFFH